MRVVLDWHCSHYPLLQASDIYKLVHQSVFGPGHVIRDGDSCRRYLVEEMCGLESGSSDAPTEPLDDEKWLVRVNLRPLLGRPGVIDRLTRVLVETAKTVKGTPEQMTDRLGAVLAWCREKLPTQADVLASAIAEARSAGYPARHHSPQYVELYHPAYRVVRLGLWESSTTRT